MYSKIEGLREFSEKRYLVILFLSFSILILGYLLSSSLIQRIGTVAFLIWWIPLGKSLILNDEEPCFWRMLPMAIFGAFFIASVLGPFSQLVLKRIGAQVAIRKIVVGPAVEELLKPIGIWITLTAWWGNLKSSQRIHLWIIFAGLIAGLTFGLQESIEKAMEPGLLAVYGSSWRIIKIRFLKGSVFLHMVWSLLVSWTFYWRFKHKKLKAISIIIPFYFGAIFMHSAWNFEHGSQPAWAFPILAAGAISLGAVLWFFIVRISKLKEWPRKSMTGRLA